MVAPKTNAPVVPREPTGGGTTGRGDDFDAVWSDAPVAPSPSTVPSAIPAPVAEPPAAPAEGEVRLYVNLGRKDRIGEAEVADLLRDAAGVVPTSLDVMNTHTYVNVRAEDADRVVAALAGREHDGRRLVCETARPRRR